MRIKAFYGTSDNAVKIQVWIAISVYVLVAIVRKELGIDRSLNEILQILSVTIFEKTPIFRDCSIVTGGRFEDRSAGTGRIDLGPAQCLRVSPQLGERLDPKPNCVGQVPTAR